MWRYALFFVALLLARASTLTLAQTSGNFDLSWSSLQSGEQSSGGAFMLNSSIGQAIAGESSGGDFSVNSGFQQCHTEIPDGPEITHNSIDVAITWHGTANVYRATNNPYFDPVTAAGSHLSDIWKDVGAISSGENYTYLIRELNGCGESANSTRVGTFHFGLTPGS